MDKKIKRNPSDFINVCVKKANHEKIKFYLENESPTGGLVGAFYDKAGIEKLEKLKKEKSKNK